MSGQGNSSSVAVRRYLASIALLATIVAALVVLGHSSDASGSLAFNSLCLVAAVGAVSLPLGVVLALVLVRTHVPFRRTALGAIGLLLFIPLFVQAAAWQAGFGLQGWATSADAGVWLAGWPAAVWVHSVAAVPWVVLFVGLGLLFVESEYEDEALLDASSPRVVWRVTLPRIAASAVAAALWIGVWVAGEMTVTDLFQVRTYAEVVYTDLAVEPGATPLGVVPGVVFTLLLVIVAWGLCHRLVPRAGTVSWRAPRIFPLGIWRWPAAVVVALVLTILLGVPLANLAYQAGVVVTPTESGWVRGWSSAKLLRLWALAPIRQFEQFKASFALAALAASAAVAAGGVLAWLARRGRTASGTVQLVVALGLAVPGPIVGLSLIWLLNRPGPVFAFLYDRTLLAPWLAQSWRVLPLATLVLWFAFRSIARENLDAAAADGAGFWRQFSQIVLPQRLPAIGASWLVAFAVAWGELAASILVVPPGVETVAIRTFGLLHGGVQDHVAAICLAVIALEGLLLAVIAITIVWLLANSRA